MAAEHVTNPGDNIDEVVLHGVRAAITEDDDGVVLVRISATPNVPLVVWWNHDVILNLEPDAHQRTSMRDARAADLASSPFIEKVRERVRQRLNEPGLDPTRAVLEAAAAVRSEELLVKQDPAGLESSQEGMTTEGAS